MRSTERLLSKTMTDGSNTTWRNASTVQQVAAAFYAHPAFTCLQGLTAFTLLPTLCLGIGLSILQWHARTRQPATSALIGHTAVAAAAAPASLMVRSFLLLR